MVQELTVLHVTLTLAGDSKRPLLKEEVESEERGELLGKPTLGWGGVGGLTQILRLKVTY